MTSFYNASQDSHYKRMLDLQERLRKSEEERIRLEERFNILVQESRNRHQACIHKLRIRYVEFLEEQRVRDERNNKLLGALDKVDNSLTLITAKTERLNVLRKQYEAYLLRVYGNQQHHHPRGGSITADSGLDSRDDQDIPPSPVVPKFVKLVPTKSPPAFPYVNEEFSISPGPGFRRTSTPETDKVSYPKKDNLRQNLNLKFFSQMSQKPPSSKPPTPSLDHYIGRIKQLVQEPTFVEEPCSVDQNTSGDLLNVTLSEDDQLESEEKRVVKRSTPPAPVVHEVQPEISEFPSLQNKPIEDALAKLASIQEVSLPVEPEPETSLHEEFKVNVQEEEEEDDTDGIEDDYDETVDIESWMPDNSDGDLEPKEVAPLPTLNRRKLEAIEEVDQPEDEDSMDHKQPDPQQASYYGAQGVQDYPQEYYQQYAGYEGYEGYDQYQGYYDGYDYTQEYQEQQPQEVAPQQPEEEKKKKDAVKAILDSDSESTAIERNPSNTESDFDFN